MSNSRGTLRWAFKFSLWQPTKEEWLLALSVVQPEEKSRVCKFVFRKDAKAALTGRLMLRKAIHDSLGIAHHDIVFGRSDKGKPYLVNDLTASLTQPSFNISHAGDYTVLVMDRAGPVGIDIMKIDRPSARSLRDFFTTMQRQFTDSEWTYINTGHTETEQLARFYRLWSLKESYVKALGDGVGFSLQRLSFHVQRPCASPGEYVTDTWLAVDGARQTDWVFEESLLDADHCVCAALPRRAVIAQQPYRTLTFSDLVKDARPLSAPEEDCWTDFSQRSERPNSL